MAAIVTPPGAPAPLDLLLPPPVVVDEALAALSIELLVTGQPLHPEAWQPPAADDEEILHPETVDPATLFEWLMGGVMVTGLTALFVLPRWLGNRRHRRGSHRHRHHRRGGGAGGYYHASRRHHRHRGHHRSTFSRGVGTDRRSSTR